MVVVPVVVKDEAPWLCPAVLRAEVAHRRAPVNLHRPAVELSGVPTLLQASVSVGVHSLVVERLDAGVGSQCEAAGP